MKTYTKEDLIEDTKPVFEELMVSKSKIWGNLLNKYEKENPGESAKIVFKVEFEPWIKTETNE